MLGYLVALKEMLTMPLGRAQLGALGSACGCRAVAAVQGHGSDSQ